MAASRAVTAAPQPAADGGPGGIAEQGGPGGSEAAVPPASVRIIEGDNLEVMAALPDATFTLVYLDPPFNTGRSRERAVETARAPGPPVDTAATTIQQERSQPADPTLENTAVPAGEAPLILNSGRTGGGGVVRRGFHGREYERVRGLLRAYDDRFDDYWAFLEPRLYEAWRLLAPEGTLYLHLDYREAHYAKVALDALFGRECFLNEIIWAYDYGAKTRRRWPTKHDTILVYVKDPARYLFDADAADREPYMAPGLVTPEKAARGKLPTDVWWHTIVPTSGREKTGYPTQKPEGILRRMIGASTRPGDTVLDAFAGSGTAGAVAAALGRNAVLIDTNPVAIEVMTTRMPGADVVRRPGRSGDAQPVAVTDT